MTVDCRSMIHDSGTIIHPRPAQSLKYMLQRVPEAFLAPTRVDDTHTVYSYRFCIIIRSRNPDVRASSLETDTYGRVEVDLDPGGC